MTVGVFSVVLTIGPYAPRVACAAISIAIFGDAAANVIGKKWGKHHFKKNKTLEGLLGGGLVSFVSAFAFLIYEDLLTATVSSALHILPIALGGAVAFMVVDFLSPSISDNLINPLASGITMALMTIFVIF